MLGWFPSDDRHRANMKDFGSLTEIFSIQTTKAHTLALRGSRILRRLFGRGSQGVLPDGHMHQARAELINTRRITNLNFNNFSIQIRVKISHKSKFI